MAALLVERLSELLSGIGKAADRGANADEPIMWVPAVARGLRAGVELETPSARRVDLQLGQRSPGDSILDLGVWVKLVKPSCDRARDVAATRNILAGSSNADLNVEIVVAEIVDPVEHDCLTSTMTILWWNDPAVRYGCLAVEAGSRTSDVEVGPC